MRLTMKAGKSSDTAMVLWSLETNSLLVSNVASSVAMPRITSTSSISGTGFMKWMPMKRSGRSVEDASRVNEIAIGKRVQSLGRLDARKRALPVVLGDEMFADLARHVAVDRGNACLDPF